MNSEICGMGLHFGGWSVDCSDMGRMLPIEVVHHTKDGSVRLKVSRVGEDRWVAQFSGPKLEGAREFKTLSGANRYLMRAFAALFPEHRCTARCRGAQRGADERS